MRKQIALLLASVSVGFGLVLTGTAAAHAAPPCQPGHLCPNEDLPQPPDNPQPEPEVTYYVPVCPPICAPKPDPEITYVYPVCPPICSPEPPVDPSPEDSDSSDQPSGGQPSGNQGGSGQGGTGQNNQPNAQPSPAGSAPAGKQAVKAEKATGDLDAAAVADTSDPTSRDRSVMILLLAIALAGALLMFGTGMTIMVRRRPAHRPLHRH